MQQQHFKLLPGSEQVGRLEEPDSKRRSTVVLRFDKESASFDPAPTPFELELKSLEDVFEIGPETWEKIAITKADLGPLGCNLLIKSFVNDFSTTLPPTSPHPERIQQLSTSFAFLLASNSFSPVSDFSPRVRTLVDVLSQHRDPPGFQTIVVVDTKRTAKLLPLILLRAEALRDWVAPECLLRLKKKRKSAVRTEEGRILDAFRAGDANVLVATSDVAETLDLSTCDLVVQFDGANGHEALAVQTLEAGNDLLILVENEEPPRLTNDSGVVPNEDDEESDATSRPSLPTAPSTPLFDPTRAISLLEQFCSRLPRDPYGAPPRPSFALTPTPTGFLASVLLPLVPALGPEPRQFEGVVSAAKARAKQGAAFAACEALQQAGALDALHVEEAVDDEGAGFAEVLDRGETVEVEFDNIWGNVLAKDSAVWLNTLEVREPGAAPVVVGLVTGSTLRLFEGNYGEETGGEDGTTSIRLLSSVELAFVDAAERAARMEGLRALNFECVKTAVNRRVPDGPFYALFVPLAPDGSIDWTAVDNAFAPATSASLLPSCIISIPSRRVEHRLYTFKKIRTDVSSLSPTRDIEIDLETRLAAKDLAKFEKYVEFVRAKHGIVLSDTESEDIVELESIDTTIPNHFRPRPAPRRPSFLRHFPISLCRTTSLPSSFWRIVVVSPSLLRTIHDEIRARRALQHLRLPPLDIPLLVQALTPPGAVIGFDYEALETLGDSLLKILTSVHLYLSNPHATEGHLSSLRRHFISNAFLHDQTLATGLAPFLLPERYRTTTWFPPESDQCELAPDGLRTKRTVARRALSDCVESGLAAAFLSGGFRMALAFGERVGLHFGGEREWGSRVPEVRNDLKRVEGMERLEKAVGYRFDCPRLLRQALTHRGVVRAPTNCYEREELLGDALLDFFVMNHLWTTFPGMSSANFTFLRARLVSNAALAFVAIRTIEVHRNLIHESREIQLAIDEAVVQATRMSWEEFHDTTWLWDPPKVLGDLVESLLGAIFVDSGCKIDAVLSAARTIFRDVLPLLKDEGPRDPISRLKIHVQTLKCHQTTLFTTPRTTSLPPSASYRYHDHPLFTASHPSQAVAGQLAARGALAILESPAFDEFERRCDCWNKRKAEDFLQGLKEFKKARMGVVEEGEAEAVGESSGIERDVEGEEEDEEELIVSRVSDLSARVSSR